MRWLSVTVPSKKVLLCKTQPKACFPPARHPHQPSRGTMQEPQPVSQLPPELLLSVMRHLPLPYLRLVCRRVCSQWKEVVDFVIPQMLVGNFTVDICGDDYYFEWTAGHHVYAYYEHSFICMSANRDVAVLHPEQKSAVRNLRGGSASETEFITHSFWTGIKFDDVEEEYDVKFNISLDSDRAVSGPWTVRFQAVEKPDTEIDNIQDNFPEEEGPFIRFISLEVSLKDFLSWKGKGVRRIVRAGSDAFKTAQQLREDAERWERKLVEMERPEEESRTKQEEQKCATCSNSKALGCIAGLCAWCCRREKYMDGHCARHYYGL